MGAAVLAVAKTADTAPIKKRLASFEAAHARYVAAHQAAVERSAALRAGKAAVADADGDQRAALERLAGALVGNGLPRRNPFAPLGAVAPGKLSRMAAAPKAKAVRALLAAVRKRKAVSKATLAAADDLEAQAARVKACSAQLPALRKAEAAGIAARDALGRVWAPAFNRLKRAAQTADDDGADGLFAALFEVEKKAPTRRRRHT